MMLMLQRNLSIGLGMSAQNFLQYHQRNLTRGPKKIEFKWRDGKRLAADPRLTIQLFEQLVDIFATLISFSSKRHTRFDHRIYRAIPTWYADAANNCRYMEDIRLSKRMLRQSMDPKMVPLVSTNGDFFMFEGELGILSKNSAPASMRGSPLSC